MSMRDIQAPYKRGQHDSVTNAHQTVKWRGQDEFITYESNLACRWHGTFPEGPETSFLRSSQLGLKRVVDVLLSAAALLALCPMFLFVIIAIKLNDRGPAFFRQARAGKDGKTFLMFKFRSMYTTKCSHDGVQQTTVDDERITPVGAFLRRTSIDELPQLINILIGDMSLVGPRPHVTGQLAAGKPYIQLVPYYDHRLAMRPGLTGWAQANGYRGPTDDPELARARVDHDMAYIQNFSLLLDLRILFKTAVHEFFRGTGF